MKLKQKWIFVLVLASCCTSVFALKVPTLEGRINDKAKIFSKKTVKEIEEKLIAHEQNTTRQFAVLTVKSLEGEPIESAAVKVANAWKLGTAKDNNGLLVLISTGDRQIRIEVGSGIEDIYTDVFTGRIIDSIITPNFKDENFDKGISDAIDALILEKYDAVEEEEIPAIVLIIAVIIVLLILAALAENGSSSGGGGFYVGSSFGGRSSGRSGSSFSGGGGGFSGGGSSGRW